jgi:hypothetical protein
MKPLSKKRCSSVRQRMRKWAAPADRRSQPRVDPASTDILAINGLAQQIEGGNREGRHTRPQRDKGGAGRQMTPGANTLGQARHASSQTAPTSGDANKVSGRLKKQVSIRIAEGA